MTFCAWLRGFAAAVPAITLSWSVSPLGAQGPLGSCTPADTALETIALWASPNAQGRVVKTVARDGAIFVREDAVTNTAGDWLKVRADGVMGWVRSRDFQCRLSPGEARRALAEDATRVVRALRVCDFAAFSRYVHPVRGVRFSPYASVSVEHTPAIPRRAVPGLPANPERRVWGFEDGSDAPIRLPFSVFWNKFIYNRNFAEAPKQSFNEILGTGNTASNIDEAYPNSAFAEYYFPSQEGDGKGTDWAALRIVFQQNEGKWYVVAIVHDGWTM